MTGIARLYGTVAVATIAFSLASAAQAQAVANGSGTAGSASPANTSDAPASQDASEVVVTGIRASQRQSINIKRNAINAVDAIASEDLGKMPAQNVA